jgi:uncharacterized protein YdaU (DUF1376 family)
MSNNGKLSWFPFYPNDYLSDEKVIVMNRSQRGSYTNLLCIAWNRNPIGTLPNDDVLLAAWAQCSLVEWSEDKVLVMNAFELIGDVWHQKRMVMVGVQQAESHKSRVEGGRKGGLSRAQGQLKPSLSLAQAQLKATSSNKRESKRENKRESKEAREDNIVDCSDGFGALKNKYPGLNVEKEYSDARAKLGKEPPRPYFEVWLENSQAQLIPGAPTADKKRSGPGPL